MGCPSITFDLQEFRSRIRGLSGSELCRLRREVTFKYWPGAAPREGDLSRRDMKKQLAEIRAELKHRRDKSNETTMLD
jgi:hypothetical protein